jgi:serine O-acetyltransferase
MCLVIYRFASFFYKKNIRFLAKFFFWLNIICCSADINPAAKIGKVSIIHSVGVVIGGKVNIGDNTCIMSGVVIGTAGYWKNGKQISKRHGDLQPIIGNNVFIGAHAVILGNIKIGDNAIIGANAFVTFDVPENAKVINNYSNQVVIS